MARTKYARKKRKDGIGFKFLIVSLLIIMFVIFLIGLQIGRIVEKTSREGNGSKVVTRAFDEEDIGERIRGDIEKMRESTVNKSTETKRVPSEKPAIGQEGDSVKLKKTTTPPENKTSLIDSKRRSHGQKKTDVRREMLFLQVGVFSVGENAERMKNRLEKYGLKVKIETYNQKKGEVLRKVLVGPFLTASEVTREKEKIERLTGIKPILVRRQG